MTVYEKVSLELRITYRSAWCSLQKNTKIISVAKLKFIKHKNTVDKSRTMNNSFISFINSKDDRLASFRYYCQLFLGP